MKLSSTHEIRLVLLTVVASFTATFAYLWCHSEPHSADANAPLDRQMAPRDVGLPLTPPPLRPPRLDTAAPEEIVPKVASRPTAADAVPAENLEGPALPLLVAVAAAQNTVGHDDNSAGEPVEEAVRNEVDILNTSEQPLAVTLVDVSPITQRSSSTQVFVTPGGQVHILANADLPIASGDALSLRSAGFRDITQTVP